MTTKPGGVRTTHRDYDEMLPVWETVRDVEEGQRAIHKQGEKYLPKLTAEEDADYKARLKRSDFFNAFWRTVAGLTGLAFRTEPQVDVPESLKPLLEDVDLRGVSLDVLAKDLTEDVLEYGRVGLLVDHPPMPNNVTALSQAAAESMGLRPTIQVYDAKCCINWRYARVDNVWKLALVVLKETATLQVSEFETKEEDRYRVLDMDDAGFYRQRVFRINEDKDEQVGATIYPLMRGKKMTEIPFRFVGTKGGEVDEPPLVDLLYANLAHFQLQSDYRHGLHFTGLPTLFLAGVTQAEGSPGFYLGSTKAITSDHPDAKGMFIEFSGQGLAPLAEAIKAQEQRMAMLGARMIADETRQAETLGATEIKRAGENSVMAAIVGAVSESITWALGWFAEWAGVSGEVSYEINRRFTPVPMTPQELTALVGAWQSGAVSEAELFAKLQEGEVIDGKKSLEEHQAEVDLAGGMPRPEPAVAA